MSVQYAELRPTNGEFGAPQLISMGFASCQRCTAQQSSSQRQPNFAALNRGRHLCSSGRPSRWALAHILVSFIFIRFLFNVNPHVFDRCRNVKNGHVGTFCLLVLCVTMPNFTMIDVCGDITVFKFKIVAFHCVGLHRKYLWNWNTQLCSK